MLKRRRKRTLKKKYTFENIFTDEIRENLQRFIETNQRTNVLDDFCSEVFSYYETNAKINATYDHFKDYVYSCLDSYIEYEELNLYFYLKRKIEEAYDLENKRYYFDDEQEFAIREYIRSEDENRRNIIYNKFLKYPIEKLAEAQLNTTKLYSHFIDYDSLLNNIISFIHEKIDRFDPNRGTKAYSYFGTTIKNRLKDIRRKEHKQISRVLSYEDMFSAFENDPKYSYTSSLYENNINLITFEAIKPKINEYYERNKDRLSEKENKVICSIIEILENWDTFFETGSNKLKKKEIYETIKNMTNLHTKDITNVLKGVRELYKVEKAKIIEDHYNKFD